MENILKKYRVIFMGTPEFAVPILQSLIDHPQIELVGIVTQPDKPVGRKGTPQPSPIKQVALKNNLPVWTPIKLKNNAEILEQIKSTSPDVIVVVAYGKILPQEILDIPPHGIVNVHGSFLPKYRGASPITGAILEGDSTTGLTLMKMVLAMDAGPIIKISDPVSIANLDTTQTLTHKLAPVGAKLLQENLIPYLEDNLASLPQDESLATYVPIIKKEDGLINWAEPAEIIERKTRAYQPWPTAYTFYQGKRLKIIQGVVLPESLGQTGQIWTTPDKYPAVTTADGSLKLTLVQPEGKTPMSGADFLRGYPALIGTILG